jgi:hypothetical protein
MLEKNGDETLDAAEHGVVDQDRRMGSSFIGNKVCVEPLREEQVQLYGSTLPIPSSRICEMKFQFRSVECAFPRLKLEGESSSHRGL